MPEFKMIFSNWNGVKGSKIIYRPYPVLETLYREMESFLKDAEMHGFSAKCEIITYTDKGVYTGNKACKKFYEYVEGKLKGELFKQICLHCEDSTGYAIWICYPP